MNSTSPDAELIAACAEFTELDRQWHALHNAYDEDEDIPSNVLAPLGQRMTVVLDRICALRAVTPEGVRARGATYVAYAPEVIEEIDRSGCNDERLLAALMRDLVGSGA